MVFTENNFHSHSKHYEQRWNAGYFYMTELCGETAAMLKKRLAELPDVSRGKGKSSALQRL